MRRDAEPFSTRWQTAASVAGALVALFGTLVLVGWLTGFRPLTRMTPGSLNVKTNAGAAFLAAGLSLVLLADGRRRWFVKAVGWALAAAVFLLAAATLLEHATGMDLGIDQLIHAEAPGAPGTASANRMGPPASICFAICGLALLLIDLRTRYDNSPSQIMMILVFAVSLLSILAYVYGAPAAYEPPKAVAISMGTAVALFVLAGGIMAARPGLGPVRYVAADDAGGFMLRRLLPAALIIPVVFGVVEVYLERRGQINPAAGDTILAMIVMVAWGAIIFRCAALVSEAEADRRQAEAARRDAEAEREELIENMKQDRERLAAANAAKDRFLAVLSHELRTPLTPIIGTVKALAADKSLPPETLEDLAMIERNAALEARLIDDLLDLTRIEQGKVSLAFENLDARATLNHALDICRTDLETRGQKVVRQLPDQPLYVRADVARLNQIVWNLIRNASKFGGDGKSIFLRAFEEGREVVISVRDEGIGISRDAMDKIFRPFEQASSLITQRFGGLGLGLTISKALVEMHGGLLTVTSDGVGQGATFTVRLPKAVMEPAPDDGVKQPEAAAGPAAVKKKLRILLVEDHPDTAKVIVRLLTRMGYDVSHAGGVESGLRAAAGDSFDLLISDIGLPDGTGLDVIRRLREGGRHLPAIVMSGYGMEDDVVRSRDAGFLEHLVKPVDVEQLHGAIERVRDLGAPASDGSGNGQVARSPGSRGV